QGPPRKHGLAPFSRDGKCGSFHVPSRDALAALPRHRSGEPAAVFSAYLTSSAVLASLSSRQISGTGPDRAGSAGPCLLLSARPLAEPHPWRGRAPVPTLQGKLPSAGD